MGDEYLFISDCHLDPARREVSDALIDFIKRRAQGARRLYILGDLFEVWIGDDDPATEHQAVLQALGQLVQHTEIFFIAGNRDFLLGQDFAARVGMTLLAEPEILRLGDLRVALMHGDSLCTDDHEYQAFRAMVRGAEWQAEFLAKSLPERQQIAAELRADSKQAMQQKSAAIMDVNRQAVVDCFSLHSVDVIVHGHTHRPGVHQYPEAGSRYVLGDWNPAPSYLSWRPQDGFKLVDTRV